MLGVEASKDRALAYLIALRKTFMYVGIFTIPTLILVWVLNFRTVFWVLFGICVLDEIFFAVKISDLEKRAGLR